MFFPPVHDQVDRCLYGRLRDRYLVGGAPVGSVDCFKEPALEVAGRWGSTETISHPSEHGRSSGIGNDLETLERGCPQVAERFGPRPFDMMPQTLQDLGCYGYSSLAGWVNLQTELRVVIQHTDSQRR